MGAILPGVQGGWQILFRHKGHVMDVVSNVDNASVILLDLVGREEREELEEEAT